MAVAGPSRQIAASHLSFGDLPYILAQQLPSPVLVAVYPQPPMGARARVCRLAAGSVSMFQHLVLTSFPLLGLLLVRHAACSQFTTLY